MCYYNIEAKKEKVLDRQTKRRKRKGVEIPPSFQSPDEGKSQKPDAGELKKYKLNTGGK